MKLGAIIHAYRIAHEMSMGDFAKLAGVSKAYIGFLEKGVNPKTGRDFAPSIKTIQSVARAMHMDFDELFNMLDGEVTLNSVTASNAANAAAASASISTPSASDTVNQAAVPSSNAALGESDITKIIKQYGTDTPEQRAALSAALDDLPIPDDKRELMKNVLQMNPEQAAAFLAFAKTVVKHP